MTELENLLVESQRSSSKQISSLTTELEALSKSVASLLDGAKSDSRIFEVLKVMKSEIRTLKARQDEIREQMSISDKKRLELQKSINLLIERLEQ